MSNIHFQGFWRMDWGLGNPNKTAALIAMLMVAVWVLAYVRRWGFWAALVLFTGLGICLVHTFSRGGLVAAFAGLGCLVAFQPRPWQRKYIVGIVMVIWVIFGFSIYLQAHQRYAKGVLLPDHSITNRLEIWKAVPRMMADAPNGWGVGKSGRAYMDWYQPLDQHESYRTLVNSHLTWLVEIGWPGRFLYFSAWFSTLLLCWPDWNKRWMVIPLGIWITFALASVFSSVAESPWLWIVPGISLLIVVFYRISLKFWPRPQAWGLPLGGAVVVTAALFILGLVSSDDLRKSEGTIVYGKGNPECLVLADAGTIGGSFGRRLREYAKNHPIPTIEFMTEMNESSLKWTGRTLVLAGGNSTVKLKRIRELLSQAQDVILLCPKVPPWDLDLPTESLAKIKVFSGEFSQSPVATNWSQVTSVTRLPGVGDFLQDWPSILFALSESSDRRRTP